MDVNEKDAAATSQYKGRTYYFCCVSCKETFDRAPERYASTP
jgi:P-type Cu+ transporter